MFPRLANFTSAFSPNFLIWNYVGKSRKITKKSFLTSFLPHDLRACSCTTFSGNMASEKKVKTICFADYDAVAFDCDHTLAQYNLYNLFKDTYEAMAEFLVTTKGYNKELFKFIPNFCSRGIVLDLKTGNFLKLAHDGTILRAFHGTKPIPKEQYRSQVWPHHEAVSKTMSNAEPRYRIFENFFDMASSLLCAQLIDHIDEKGDGRPTSYNVWPIVVQAVKYVYIPDQYKGAGGAFFDRWNKDLKRYVEGTSVKLKDWLGRMKANDRPMFILSSAYEDLAVMTLRLAVGDDWTSYFDFSVFLAEKPKFFYGKNPFYQLSPSYEQIVTNDLSNCKSIFGGNLDQLMEHLSRVTGKPNPKVLYFGDSARSDIIPSKVHAGWDTVLILEEMACETCFCHDRRDHLKVENCQFQDPTVMPWGSVLSDCVDVGCDGARKTSSVHTMVCSVARRYSDVVIPNLQFIFDFPIDHKFSTFDPDDPTSLSGFHPFIPASLEDRPREQL